VVGRSGCGKSILLRLIAGLEAADGGRIGYGERKLTLDERTALPRPRARGDAAFAQLEERILSRVLGRPASRPDGALGDVSLSRTVNQVAWAI
jgi:ABC-type cobalamin/Fe3+-siderophores transport system ATPase subunit